MRFQRIWDHRIAWGDIENKRTAMLVEVFVMETYFIDCMLGDFECA